MQRTAIVVLLAAIPVGGTASVLLVASGVLVAPSGHTGPALGLTLPLAVLWAVALGWVAAQVRGVVLGLIVFGGLIAGINAVVVATMAARAAGW